MDENRRSDRGILAVKRIVFASVMGALCLVGLLWMFRPTVSEVEKRDLAQFPKITLQGVWDGSFFSAIDTWYADTYPMRESLIGAQQSMESRYGIRTTQMIDGGVVADAIPDANTTPDPDATPAPTAEPTPTPDGTVHEIGEFISGVYITGNSAYGMYYFSQSGADAYIDTMNTIYANTGDKVNMYVLDAPVAGSIMLGDDVRAEIGSSDESAAIDYIYEKLDPGIHTLQVCDILREHNSEYIYFHTDHHWTQLGSYYAYRVFCEEKGWTPHELSEFETMTFAENRFLGSFYTSSNKSPQLAANPDTVHAWVPNGTRDMHMVLADGSEMDLHIILDTYEFSDNSTYMIFAGADRPFAHAHNETITDGSAVMVVKDSYGNCFIPWLIDHYEDVYWVDFRYTHNTVSQMVEDYGIQDVIWESATSNATSGLCNDMFLAIGQ